MKHDAPRGIRIRPVTTADAGQILTVQRAAFLAEARIYNSTDLPALTETLEQLRADLADNLGCVAVDGDRVVGVARARASGELLLIGRIAIAPDVQGTGVGSALLSALERRGAASGCREAELFTGSLSTTNLALYEHRGYRETERVDSGAGVAEVFLRKTLTIEQHQERPMSDHTPPEEIAQIFTDPDLSSDVQDEQSRRDDTEEDRDAEEDAAARAQRRREREAGLLEETIEEEMLSIRRNHGLGTR